jgi:hypothetical protein
VVRVAVVSSELRTVGYDPDANFLEIEFTNGGVYRYLEVSSLEHSNLLTASSKGRYFNQRIRNKYRTVRIRSPRG